MNFKNIGIIGAGYVGLSYAALLSKSCKVSLVENDKNKVKNLLKGKLPVCDSVMEKAFNENFENITILENIDSRMLCCDLIIFALPTNYDDQLNFFDTSVLSDCIEKTLEFNVDVPFIIKSTIPVGYTSRIIKKTKKENIFFSPEFLREGTALIDNQYPSRIIIGGESKISQEIGSFFSEFSLNEPEVLCISSDAAESIKLFSNTYLALRVAFFNEMDSYCLEKNIETKDVIKGVCLDSRIGDFYNNPSFGYGGYCLPKDTKQLLANYKDIPQSLIQAIVDANKTRKDFLSDIILNQIKDEHEQIGIYRLIMKSDSDNIRESSVQGIIKRLKSKGIKIMIYEPLIKQKTFFGSEVVTDEKTLFKSCKYIIANRMSSKINPKTHQIFTRDIFGQD